MRAARIGALLLGLGALVGAAAGVGLLLGFEPARLPAALLNIAAYKLTFLAAAGLLAAGAIVLRYGRGQRPTGAASPGPANGARELRPGWPAQSPLQGDRGSEREHARTSPVPEERGPPRS